MPDGISINDGPITTRPTGTPTKPSIVEYSIAEQAVGICNIMNKCGLTYDQGGMGTYEHLIKIFDSNFYDSEKSINYAINQGWIINLYNENEIKTSILRPIKVPGTSNFLLTFNPFYGTGIPPEVLGSKIINSNKLSPRARIEKLLKHVGDYNLNLDILNLELESFIDSQKIVYDAITKDTKDQDVIKLMGEGFDITSNAVSRIEKDITAKNKADILFSDYSGVSLQHILNLNPNDFSDELYSGKPPKSNKSSEGDWSMLNIFETSFTKDDIDKTMVDNWDDAEYSKFEKILLSHY